MGCIPGWTYVDLGWCYSDAKRYPYGMDESGICTAFITRLTQVSIAAVLIGWFLRPEDTTVEKD